MAKKRNRTIGSLSIELIEKSRESALCAIRIFNDPHVLFKSETFIVLMIISWTYLLHSHYRKKNIEYRYFELVGFKKKFQKTKHGAYKYWELERCLDERECPLEKEVIMNLKFLIGLRHEIEHQMTSSLDQYLSGRYQACAVNYNEYIKKLFGDKYGLDNFLSFCIQFSEISDEQLLGPSPQATIPERLRAYVVKFDSSLGQEEFNSPKFSYRLLFKKKLVNHPGQADKVVEFIDSNSELAKTIDKEFWVKKETERMKFRAKDVVAIIRNKGFVKFRIQPEHVNFWKTEDAKKPGKNYGVDVAGTWFWYETWVNKCIELCELHADKYK